GLSFRVRRPQRRHIVGGIPSPTRGATCLLFRERRWKAWALIAAILLQNKISRSRVVGLFPPVTQFGGTRPTRAPSVAGRAALRDGHFEHLLPFPPVEVICRDRIGLGEASRGQSRPDRDKAVRLAI